MADAETDSTALIADMGRRARAAARVLGGLSSAVKARALDSAAEAIREAAPAIAAANAEDMARAEAAGLSSAMLDRLRLDAGRIEATAAGVAAVAGLRDPVGQLIDESRRAQRHGAAPRARADRRDRHHL